MKGKGLVKTFTIILSIICLWELFPTFYVNKIEKEAARESDGTLAGKQQQIEKLAKDTLNLGFAQMDYFEAKKREANLGLDLKGGLNLLLEISEKDLLLDLADNTDNPVFLKALEVADLESKNSRKDYTTLFFNTFDKVKVELGQPNLMLSSPDIFGTRSLEDVIKLGISDSEVKVYISSNVESKVNTAIDVIRTRIDKFGVTQPNVQRVPGTGRIQVELPGITDAERIKKLLQTSARLEFWEVYSPLEISAYIQTLNQKVAENQLNNYFVQTPSNAVAMVRVSDTAAVNKIIYSQRAKELLPSNLKHLKLLWGSKPDSRAKEYIDLFAIRGNKTNKAPLMGAVTEASVTFDNFNRIQISMQMSSAGAVEWKNLTEKNIGKAIAVILDDLVYTAPNVNSVIPNGQSVISGNFNQQEANDLVDVLKSGRLPAKAHIVQSDVVGPSLGQDSINNGFISFIISYVLILAWMIFYYGRAGVYSSIALIFNLFFLVGIMVSFGFVITLPGIAGIVLTMGMAIDANIIIFERVKEELNLGKPLKQAFKEGQKHAMNAIIDANITTLIVGFVLWKFGTGPIQGFAIALVVGVFCTLFTAIFIAGIFINRRIDKGGKLAFTSAVTKKWFTNIRFQWMEKRKYAYIFSLVIMLIGLGSVFTKGFDLGVDYTGGSTFAIRLDKTVQPEEISKALENEFIENGEKINIQAKRFGDPNQVKLTTKFGVGSSDPNMDSVIKEKLFKGLANYLPADYTKDKFINCQPYGILSSSEVGPSVANDIVFRGMMAVAIALAGIFIYILVRFRNWQVSLGAVVALIHDAVVVMGIFSLLSWINIVPFSIELNQDFIAAILTVIAYSINDSVIVFDRIRENKQVHPIWHMKELYNNSINQILGRTINTAISTLLAVLVMFLFGGESIQGFMFALLVGFIFGMYSSVYIAAAISYDFSVKKEKKEKKAQLSKK